MKKVIQLKNVWKTFQVGDSQLHALRDINLDIYKGEFLAILGQSGSGKSTMLNMVGSLDLPSRGKILLDNTDISKLEESQLAQLRGKKIGFIFQQFNLIPNLSSLENVALPLIFQDVAKEKRNKKARDAEIKEGRLRPFGEVERILLSEEYDVETWSEIAFGPIKELFED